MNPVLQRELASILVSRRTFILQVALLAVLSVIVLVRWPSDGLIDTNASQARDVFRTFGYGLAALLALIVPAYPATSIVKERNQGTLQLLLNSAMSPRSIFLGKWLGTVAFVGWLLVLTAPALAACFLMGGVSLTTEVAALYVLLLFLAGEVTAIGLLVSTTATSADSALRLTYGVVVALAIGTLIPFWLFQGAPGPLAMLSDQLRALSPLSALLELMGQSRLGSQGLANSETVYGRYLISAGLVILVCGVATIMRLDYRLFDRNRAAGRMTDELGLGQRLLRRLLFLVDPQRRTALIGNWTNPVFVKELRSRRFGRLHWILRLVAACAVLSMGITYLSAQGTQAWGVATVGGIMVVLQVGLILFLMPAIASGLVSSDVESGSWTLLQMTPLSTWRILLGKLASALLPAALILLGTLPGYLILMWIEPELGWQVRRVLVSLLLAALVAVCVGAACSSVFRRTSTATAVAYAILLGMMAVTFLFWLGRDAPFGHSLVEFMLVFNPVAAAFSDMQTPGFQSYQLTPLNWWLSGTLCVVAIVILAARAWRLSLPR